MTIGSPACASATAARPAGAATRDLTLSEAGCLVQRDQLTVPTIRRARQRRRPALRGRRVRVDGHHRLGRARRMMRRPHARPRAPRQRPHRRQAAVGNRRLEGQVAACFVGLDERRPQQEAVAAPQTRVVVRHRSPNPARPTLVARPGDDDRLARLGTGHRRQTRRRNHPRPDRQRACRLVQRNQLAVPTIGRPRQRRRSTLPQRHVRIDRQHLGQPVRRVVRRVHARPRAPRQRPHRRQVLRGNHRLEGQVAPGLVRLHELRPQQGSGCSPTDRSRRPASRPGSRSPGSRNPTR